MSFDNCTQAYTAGRADILRGDPQYGTHLDRDGDGVACEVKDAPDGFLPRPAPGKPATDTSTTTGQPDQLPQTGPGEITIAGGLLLAAGAAAVIVMRRRRTRFTV